MFTASYPARFLAEKNGKGFHVRFPDLPEALTGADNLEDTMLQASWRPHHCARELGESRAGPVY